MVYFLAPEDAAGDPRPRAGRVVREEQAQGCSMGRDATGTAAGRSVEIETAESAGNPQAEAEGSVHEEQAQGSSAGQAATGMAARLGVGTKNTEGVDEGYGGSCMLASACRPHTDWSVRESRVAVLEGPDGRTAAGRTWATSGDRIGDSSCRHQHEGNWHGHSDAEDEAGARLQEAEVEV